MEHDAERMRAGRDREDGGAEHFLLFLHGHADDVVDRQQRPNQQHRRQQRHANAVDHAVPASRSHIVTSLRRNWSISRITSGISKVSAVSTVDMPTWGSPSSNAFRMPK